MIQVQILLNMQHFSNLDFILKIKTSKRINNVVPVLKQWIYFFVIPSMVELAVTGTTEIKID